MIYRFEKKRKLNAEINVVPYIDVMLVLLIIFMVLSPLLIQGIEVNLPQTDTTRMATKNEPLVISIDQNGNYSTIGIESPDQNTGIQYGFNNMPGPGASLIQNNMAIKFTTDAPSGFLSNSKLQMSKSL